MTHNLGELEDKIRANQIGLLFLFDQAGIPTSDVVRLKDLAKLQKVSYDKYLEAYKMLYPETYASASPIGVYQNGIESASERVERLGLDTDYSYSAHAENFDSFENQVVSYKTILTYIGWGVLIALVCWLLWYFYKKMK